MSTGQWYRSDRGNLMRKRTAFFGAGLLSIVLAAGCSSARKDRALVTEIQARMFADAQTKSSDIYVAVKNGEVTLTGSVPNDAARLAAYKIAANTPGASHVVDQMNVVTAQANIAREQAPMANRHTKETPEPARSTHRKKARHVAEVTRAVESEPMPAPEPAAASAAPAEAVPDPAPATPPPSVAVMPAPEPAPPVEHVQIPAGTSLRVQLIDSIDSAVNHAGELFHATLAAPVVVDDQVVVPTGTDVYVRLTDAASAGHMTGKSELGLQLSRMEFQGKSYPLVSNRYSEVAGSRGKDTAKKVGGGAVIGAILGAVIGGGKGAAIGAAAGAGGGAVYQGATDAKQVKIASETKLDFTLDAPVDVSYTPGQNAPPRS